MSGPTAAAAAVLGSWDLLIRTPIGSIGATVTFDLDGDHLLGRAVGRDETVSLDAIVATPFEGGVRVTWRQRITRPLRLQLEFDVAIRGDELTGTSRAGRLPSSAVSGRRSTSPNP